MYEFKEPTLAKLFVSLIFAPQADLTLCTKNLIDELGPIDYMSTEMEFAYTDFYREEMGAGLKRQILGFERLIARQDLPRVKVFTSQVEQSFSDQGRRAVNIDPGYIAPEHLILATHKGYYHRPYLDKGVYADLTLVYQDKKYRELEWTYPDYKSEEMKKLFARLRDDYIFKLREAALQ